MQNRKMFIIIVIIYFYLSSRRPYSQKEKDILAWPGQSQIKRSGPTRGVGGGEVPVIGFGALEI